MDAKEFAQLCYDEKENFIKEYFEKGESAVSVMIKQLNLSEDKMKLLRQMIDTALTDVFYTMLLALDGETSLGHSEQQTFKVICEDGSVISECGELEAAAYEAFYE